MSLITQKVIDWILKEEYSRNHWLEVATEMQVKAAVDGVDASELLAEAIKNFHYKYKVAVIKPNNLLNDLVDHCYDQVDWLIVAQNIIERKSK